MDYMEQGRKGGGVEGGGERERERTDRGKKREGSGWNRMDYMEQGRKGGGVEGGGERERERTDREKRERGRVGTGWITWSRGGRGEG